METEVKNAIPVFIELHLFSMRSGFNFKGSARLISSNGYVNYAV